MAEVNVTLDLQMEGSELVSAKIVADNGVGVMELPIVTVGHLRSLIHECADGVFSEDHAALTNYRGTDSTREGYARNWDKALKHLQTPDDAVLPGNARYDATRIVETVVRIHADRLNQAAVTPTLRQQTVAMVQGHARMIAMGARKAASVFLG